MQTFEMGIEPPKTIFMTFSIDVLTLEYILIQLLWTSFWERAIGLRSYSNLKFSRYIIYLYREVCLSVLEINYVSSKDC